MKDRLTDTIEEFNGFKFNENRICLNPKILINYKHGHNHGPNYMTISMAEYRGKLYGAYDYWFVDGGGGCGVYIGNPKEAFDNERELAHHYLSMFERELNMRIRARQNSTELDCKLNVQELNHFLRKVGEYKDLYDPKQLTLF